MNHPKTLSLDRFEIVAFPFVNLPLAAVIESGRFRFTMSNANPVTRIDYLGGTPPVKAVSGVVLEPLTTPIPFP